MQIINLFVSQVITFPSNPDVTNSLVLVSYSMFLTQLVWPCKVQTLVLRFRRSQSATVVSSEQVAKSLLSRNLEENHSTHWYSNYRKPLIVQWKRLSLKWHPRLRTLREVLSHSHPKNSTFSNQIQRGTDEATRQHQRSRIRPCISSLPLHQLSTPRQTWLPCVSSLLLVNVKDTRGYL